MDSGVGSQLLMTFPITDVLMLSVQLYGVFRSIDPSSLHLRPHHLGKAEDLDRSLDSP